MAKYTELLAEYLKDGGTLPAVFEDIDGLKELFVGKYIEREIGFETPELFQIKLEYKANLLVPVYKKRMDELSTAYDAMTNPIKKRIRTGTLQRQYGERSNTNAVQPNTVKITQTDFPTGAAVDSNRVPTHVTQTDNPKIETVNTAQEYTDNENYQDITDSEEGASLSEALQRLQLAERSDLKNLMEELLNEFNPLFMGIW